MKMDRRADRHNGYEAFHRVSSNSNIRNIRISAKASRINTSAFSNRNKTGLWNSPWRFCFSRSFAIFLSARLRRVTLVAILSLGAPCSAQTKPPASPQSAQNAAASNSLPKQCLAPQSGSEQISMLLETVKNHPTAGAYNTLGALFAAAGQVNCAIPAFQISLRLDAKNWEAHYNLALALLTSGDPTHATTELRAAIHEKPDSATSHFALGTLLYNQKKLTPAAAEFDAVLKIDPNFPGAAISLAQVLVAQGNTPAAIALLQKALAQPRAPEQVVPVTVALGLAYSQAGQPAQAMETLQELVASHPDSAEAHVGLGVLEAGAQPPSLEAAIVEFREALRLDPNKDEARLSLGRALISQQNFSDAIAPLREYVEREPLDYQGYYAAGLAYKGLQQWDPSVELLQRAARLNPSSYEVHYELGFALAETGQTERAIRELRAAEKIRPSAPEVHDQLARLLAKSGQKELAQKEHAESAALASRGDPHAEAGKFNAQANQFLATGDARAAAGAYRQALRADPKNPQLHYNLSLALDKLGDQSAERHELEKAIQLNPDLAVAHNQLGVLAMQRGRRAEAEAAFKKAIASDPQYADAQNNLGVLYSREGKDSDAATFYRHAIASDPKYTKAYVNLGLLLAEHGQVAQGEQQLRTAIQMNPGDPGAYTALGMIQGKTGRAAEAVESFRKAVSLEPNSADAHLNLGIALVDQYDRTNGFKEFSEAARLDPRSPAVHYNLGRFYFETAQYGDARKELEEALRLEPNHAPSLYFLALAAKQDNDLDRSTELFEKVIALQPGNPDAQFLLGQNLEHQGKTAEAIAHWKLALQADPNYSQALYNLARALRKSNDSEAQQYQDRYDTLQKNQQITDRVQQLGNFALEASNAQNWPQAFAQMQEALELCGECPEAAHLHKNLGMMYVRTGKLEQAQKELQTALQFNPDDNDAKQGLAAIQNAASAQRK
jgi:tetratricopeptide (TPR) repeat protein